MHVYLDDKTTIDLNHITSTDIKTGSLYIRTSRDGIYKIDVEGSAREAQEKLFRLINGSPEEVESGEMTLEEYLNPDPTLKSIAEDVVSEYDEAVAVDYTFHVSPEGQKKEGVDIRMGDGWISVDVEEGRVLEGKIQHDPRYPVCEVVSELISRIEGDL